MTRAAAALLASILCAGAATAHHGFGTFDLNQDIALSGTLTKIDFVNPHSWLYLDVVGENGEVAAYRCEMRGATVLRRSGWSKEMFTVGETISITGAPDRRDPNSCYLGTLTFQDGASMDRYGQLTAAPVPQERPAQLPTGEPNIFGDWAPEQVVMTDPRGIVGTLVPLSRAPSFEPGQVPSGATPFPGSRGADPSLRSFASTRVPLTPAGQEAANGYEDLNPATNPRMRCESTSIIFDLTFDSMIHRISQVAEDAILFEYGQYGLARTIHLGLAEHPADLASSHAGHSIGRWEGDALVVDTVGFTPGILYPPLYHGEKLHVVERIRLGPEPGTLIREYSAEDPDFFVGAFEGADTLLASPLPFAPDTCVEQSFINYSEEAQP
jgi:hypothetical protein